MLRVGGSVPYSSPCRLLLKRFISESKFALRLSIPGKSTFAYPLYKKTTFFATRESLASLINEPRSLVNLYPMANSLSRTLVASYVNCSDQAFVPDTLVQKVSASIGVVFLEPSSSTAGNSQLPGSRCELV